jgi:hypothetical protein
LHANLRFRTLAADERIVIAHRDAEFPRSAEHVGEYYTKGLAYVAAGRPDDGARMLRQGDRAFDVGERGEVHIDFENAPRAIRQMDASGVERLRALLLQKLGEARPAPTGQATHATPP